MKKLLYDFVKNWYLIDKNNTDALLSLVEKFAFSISKKMNIKQNFKVKWKPNQNIFILGSCDTETKTIFLNINRIISLEKYKIKSETKKFIKYAEDFIANFNNITQPDETDKALYFTLTNKPKKYFRFLGNYEYIPFDIATTILHELRHVYQTEQAEQGDNFFIYITKNNLRYIQKNFNPMREPSEIDAIYFQLKIFKEYCDSNNLQDAFIKSYNITVPKFNKKDINDNIKFITNNSKLYLTVDNISKLKLELETIYNWRSQ